VHFQQLDDFLLRSLPQIGNGVALVVATRDQMLYEQSFGNLSAGSVIQVASAAKWLSAAVVMTLVDEGKVNLDDPVSKFIPEFRDEKAAITVRKLLAHTSGIRGQCEEDLASCMMNRSSSLELCAREIASIPLAAKPGTLFSYSNLAMQAGGRVAEVAGGQTWQDMFRARIAAPLEMIETTYSPGKNPFIGSGVRSSARDYVRFLQMILRGGSSVLSRESVAEMQKDQTDGAEIGPDHPFEAFGHIDARLPSTRYGLGEWREMIDENDVVLSSPGATGFTPWIDLRGEFAAVLSVKSTFDQIVPIRWEMMRILRREIL